MLYLNAAYDDVPYPRALTTHFLAVHGSALSLFTPKYWSMRLYAPFLTCPNLRRLSLEIPLPVFGASCHGCRRFRTGDNTIASSFYSPTSSRLLEMLLPSVPSLKIVRIRDVRWLRKGLSCHAQEAASGVRGEMRVWRQRLAKRGIRLLDGNWKDMDWKSICQICLVVLVCMLVLALLRL